MVANPLGGSPHDLSRLRTQNRKIKDVLINVSIHLPPIIPWEQPINPVHLVVSDAAQGIGEPRCGSTLFSLAVSISI